MWGDTIQGGDTRVKSIKVIVMSKKRSSVFQEKINGGDTAELVDGDD